MIKILFICHGNICRSPMAEFIMKDKVKKLGMEDMFEIASAATSSEEIWNGVGNPMFPSAKDELQKHGIACAGKKARQIVKSDYEEYDYLIGMDDANIRNMKNLFGDGDKILKTVRGKFAGIDVEFLNDSVLAPHEVDANSSFVKTLISIYEDYTGLKGECIAMGGGTYVHNIENGVAFGAVFPGTDTKMHGADEFVVIDELIASAKIFAQSIVELCN